MLGAPLVFMMGGALLFPQRLRDQSPEETVSGYHLEIVVRTPDPDSWSNTDSILIYPLGNDLEGVIEGTWLGNEWNLLSRLSMTPSESIRVDARHETQRIQVPGPGWYFVDYGYPPEEELIQWTASADYRDAEGGFHQDFSYLVHIEEEGVKSIELDYLPGFDLHIHLPHEIDAWADFVVLRGYSGEFPGSIHHWLAKTDHAWLDAGFPGGITQIEVLAMREEDESLAWSMQGEVNTSWRTPSHRRPIPVHLDKAVKVPRPYSRAGGWLAFGGYDNALAPQVLREGWGWRSLGGGAYEVGKWADGEWEVRSSGNGVSLVLQRPDDAKGVEVIVRDESGAIHRGGYLKSRENRAQLHPGRYKLEYYKPWKRERLATHEIEVELVSGEEAVIQIP